ncbi:hypothetical protein [Desulfoluna butyratoxydans]|uniref:Uncharacterized protein n=1 Tax=Desulfoluna butyratoxydans TaxID=231438 RepID=A0A4U8YRV7_9BACT|nr:hypothetical protein [Desulfoluna butyratoxydans]VFQ46069.1 hypothetical protein MSL71_37320 [Desulfoluna butyratoxydans]
MENKPTYEELEAKVRSLTAMLEDEGRVVQWEVLGHLALAWDRDGPPGIVENRDLAEALGLGKAAIAVALKQLSTLGITDHDTMGYASYLTQEGYDIAKRHDRTVPIEEQITKAKGGRIKGRWGKKAKG